MAGVPRRALDTILKSKWAGTHYSTSVWQNRDAMAGILDRALMEQASMGKLSDMTMQDVRGMVDLNKWRNQVKSKFKTEAQYQKYAANRLIRTESAYVANQTTAVAYEECGIERYEYMATLDSRTSEKCSGLDGKIFEVSEKEVGVNWPPAHPHCRSSVAPVIDGLTREGLTRAARDANGKTVYVPRDMKYQEWKAWQKDGAPADVNAWRESKAPKPVVSLDKNSDFMLKLGEEHYGNITKLANAAPDVPRNAWAKQQSNVRVADAKHKRQAYNDSDGIHVDITKDAKGNAGKMPYAETIHEAWHNIDHRLGNGTVPLSASGKFGETLKADFKRLVEARRVPTSTGRIPSRKEALKSISREFFNLSGKETGALVDILEGVSNGGIESLIGHGKEYWKQRWALEKEAFANIGEMSMTSPKGYEMFQQMFPQSHSVWLDMLKGAV
jgi:SPP1 gp7 family putative phage head morphogenesis protein